MALDKCYGVDESGLECRATMDPLPNLHFIACSQAPALAVIHKC